MRARALPALSTAAGLVAEDVPSQKSLLTTHWPVLRGWSLGPSMIPQDLGVIAARLEHSCVLPWLVTQ